MGGDKLLLEVGGVPLVERVYGALSAWCSEVILAGGGSALGEGVHRTPDVRAGGQGPLAGMEAGLTAARHGLVFVAAGDLPFLPGELVGFLLGRLEELGSRAVVPRYGGRTHPLCAAYDHGILPPLRSALDDGVRSVREFLARLEAVEYVEGELRRFGDPTLFLMNVNSPGDLERARRGARS